MTAMNMIAQASLICDGDLDRIQQWIKLTGYVNCTDEFTQHPTVLDGATRLLEDVFGEVGLATRTAVGVNSLPMNIAVEIQADFEIRL
jgi:enamine deaminase RidA (YjgF/YER057c/UK114 family)